MFVGGQRIAMLCGLALATCLWPGCVGAAYRGVVKPVPRLSVLSPELENLTDVAIETYLTADVRPVFPSVLAVAKVSGRQPPALETIRGEEAEGWRALAGEWDSGAGVLLKQVQFVSPLLVSGPPTLKRLRDAAALLHAPLLFVYLQEDASSSGYNSAAMAYWTLIGLFCIPGNTVGYHSVCQAVLVDTRSGFILATAGGESFKEEDVLLGAVEIADDRTREQARAQAVAALQQDFRATLPELALKRGVSDR